MLPFLLYFTRYACHPYFVQPARTSAGKNTPTRLRSISWVLSKTSLGFMAWECCCVAPPLLLLLKPDFRPPIGETLSWPDLHPWTLSTRQIPRRKRVSSVLFASKRSHRCVLSLRIGISWFRCSFHSALFPFLCPLTQ